MSGKRIASSVIIVLLVGAALWYGSQTGTEHRFTALTAPLKILKPNPEVSILVVGDIMLDRNVRNKINEVGFDKFMEGVKDLLTDADLTVGNLEGPFTTYPSKTASLKSKELVFTFDPALAPKLAEVGFDILGLANNHTMNFGREGLAMTKQYLSSANISYYGDPNNKDGLSVMLEKNGITIGFVGFHEFTYVNFDKVLAEVDRLAPLVDILIVSPHWGPEYQKEPTEKMKGLAHLWIDHGADFVIGAHPHVIGDIEEYKGRTIFYSLGNFIFDQYFSKETSEGLVVKIELEKEGDTIRHNYTLTKIVIDRDRISVSE